MKIYLDNGYLNIDEIMNNGQPFSFVCGGRGTGKTFGSLKYVLEHKIKFILMRRTQSQVDLINKPEFNPFKAVNSEFGYDITTSPLSKYNVGYYHTEENDGKIRPTGSPIGYSMALSTISNLRGFDASDVELLIYDEFIPERHERPIKNEGAAFLNAYETINRNRELQGKAPLKVVCLANANDLGNPIFMELKLINKAEEMRRKGQEISIMKNKGIALYILNNSPISKMKKETALYALTSGSEFEQMALQNRFAELNSISIKSMPITEYRSIVTIGEITLYKHKSNGSYYVTTLKQGSPMEFGTSDTERARFLRKYYWIWTEYMKNNIIFENSTCEVYLTKYCN